MNFTGKATGTYNSPDVAAANTVTFGGLTLDNSDYALTMQGNASAKITPKTVTLSPPKTLTMTYSGSTAYTGDINYASLTSALGVTGDSVTGITLTYETPDVGVGKKVFASSATVKRNGVDVSGDYAIHYSNESDGIISVSAAALFTYMLDTTLRGNNYYSASLSDSDKRVYAYYQSLARAFAADPTNKYDSYFADNPYDYATGMGAMFLMGKIVKGGSGGPFDIGNPRDYFNTTLADWHIEPVDEGTFNLFALFAKLRLPSPQK